MSQLLCVAEKPVFLYNREISSVLRMKQKHTHKPVGPVTSVLLLLGATLGAFTVGFRTADEGSVVQSIMATSDVLAGDFDGNGVINNDDVAIAIELSAHLRAATPEELKADPNQDGDISAADTLWLMQHIKYTVHTGTIR
jgi:hypothetical protein